MIFEMALGPLWPFAVPISTSAEVRGTRGHIQTTAQHVSLGRRQIAASRARRCIVSTSYNMIGPSTWGARHAHSTQSAARNWGTFRWFAIFLPIQGTLQPHNVRRPHPSPCHTTPSKSHLSHRRRRIAASRAHRVRCSPPEVAPNHRSVTFRDTIWRAPRSSSLGSCPPDPVARGETAQSGRLKRTSAPGIYARTHIQNTCRGALGRAVRTAPTGTETAGLLCTRTATERQPRSTRRWSVPIGRRQRRRRIERFLRAGSSLREATAARPPPGVGPQVPYSPPKSFSRVRTRGLTSLVGNTPDRALACRSSDNTLVPRKDHYPPSVRRFSAGRRQSTANRRGLPPVLPPEKPGGGSYWNRTTNHRRRDSRAWGCPPVYTP